MNLKCKESVFVTELAESLALLDMKTGTYFSLNHSGGLIWNKIGEGISPKAIVDIVCAEYNVDEATARRDYDRLVESLLAEGLLVPDDETTPS